LQPRIDHTNAETDYTRNRIRLELIPAIENSFNPNIKEALVRLASNSS
jgi:tRNA(Ile)-lysidine synthase